LAAIVNFMQLPTSKQEESELPFTDEELATVQKYDQEMLFAVLLAANYLDIKALLQACCKATAELIKGKTPAEIRELFGIENDFTPEQEEKIRKENEWMSQVKEADDVEAVDYVKEAEADDE